MLPARRLELTIAKVAHTVALANGAAGLPLSEFLFDPVEEAKPEDAAAFFKFNPRPKKRIE